MNFSALSELSRRLVLILAVSSPCIAAGQTISLFPLANSSDPAGITAGPDGNLWFTETRANRIGRITPEGVIAEFATPTIPSGPVGITSGPDGALWFAEEAGNSIGRITTNGSITEFPMPTPTTRGGPTWIVVGPDGNLWFTEQLKDKIGRITLAGIVTEFDLPLNTGPQGITSGPDGNLWFVGYNGSIGRITTSGTLSWFAVPTLGAYPFDITSGPDGALWFTEPGTDKVGRITTQGVVTEFHVSRPPNASSSVPAGITAGPGNRLWFGESFGNSIGSMTTTGAVTHYPLPPALQVGGGYGITVGPDGNLWFTDSYYDLIGRLALPLLTALSPAEVWVGLRDGEDAGMRFDLKAEVLKNGSLIGSGELDGVSGGGIGFNRAILDRIPLTLSAPTVFLLDDTLSIRLSVRAGATGHRSGTARLWLNDSAADSRFGATIEGTDTDFHLLDGFFLGTSPGPGPKRTIDVFVDRAAGGNPFKPFGTWSKTLGGPSRNPTDLKYLVEDLGRVPDPLYVTEGFAVTCINDAGQTAGWAKGPALSYHAYLVQGADRRDLGTLASFPSAISQGYAINNHGNVVGTSQTDSVVYHPFLYRDGTMIDVGVLSESGQQAWAFGINDHDQVVGQSWNGAGYRAFLYDRGMLQDLGLLPGGVHSGARAINNRGDVVGNSGTFSSGSFGDHAFLWRGGTMIDLGTLPSGFRSSLALAINDLGEIVGSSATNQTDFRAVLWTPAREIMDLGTLGGRVSIANSINNRSQIVGAAEVSTDHFHAFFYQQGLMTDLNDALPPDSPWELTDAVGINGVDQIVGHGFFNGELHSYLATPAAAIDARLWVGLKNSDDVGMQFDLKAEALKNGSVIGSGEVDGVSGGGSGFDHAILDEVRLTFPEPVVFLPGDVLSIRLSVRAGAAGHRSGTARLWFNDPAADSRFDATIDGMAMELYPVDGFVLGTSPGPGPKRTIDVFVDRAAGGNPFKPLGTWSRTF